MLTLAPCAEACLLNAQAGPNLFAPWQGTRLGELQTFQLGQGNVGTVFRVFEAAGAYEIKVYRDLRRGWDRETQQWAQNVPAATSQQTDLTFFRLFAKAPPESFAVPGVTPTTVDGAPALRFDKTVWGKSVFKLLEDKDLDADLRLRIEKRYVQGLEAFAEYLRREFKGTGGIDKDPSAYDPHKYPHLNMGITYTVGNTTTSTHVHIAADGVIVESTTLIPHLRDPN